MIPTSQKSWPCSARQSTGHSLSRVIKESGVPTATDAEVEALSEHFGEVIRAAMDSDGDRGSFEAYAYRMFEAIDHDKNGRLSYIEFEWMLRNGLQTDVDGASLQGLWKALDRDGNGYLCQGEWIGFLRHTQRKVAVHTRALARAARQKERRDGAIERRTEQERALYQVKAYEKAHAAQAMERRAAELEAALEAEQYRLSTAVSQGGGSLPGTAQSGGGGHRPQRRALNGRRAGLLTPLAGGGPVALASAAPLTPLSSAGYPAYHEQQQYQGQGYLPAIADEGDYGQDYAYGYGGPQY